MAETSSVSLRSFPFHFFARFLALELYSIKDDGLTMCIDYCRRSVTLSPQHAVLYAIGGG